MKSKTMPWMEIDRRTHGTLIRYGSHQTTESQDRTGFPAVIYTSFIRS